MKDFSSEKHYNELLEHRVALGGKYYYVPIEEVIELRKLGVENAQEQFKERVQNGRYKIVEHERA